MLFVAQGLDGLDTHCLDCRKCAGGAAEDEEYQHYAYGLAERYLEAGGAEHGIGREIIDQTEHDGGETYACRAGDKSEQYALAEHLHRDIGRFRAYRAPDTELVGALLDDYPHDIAHAYHAGEQRSGADKAGKDRYAEEEAVDHLEVLGHIHKPEGAVVVGMYGMAAGKEAAYGLLVFRRFMTGRGCIHEKAHFVALVEGLPQRGAGYYVAVVDTAHDACLAELSGNAYDSEIHAVEAQALADGRLVAEKFGGYVSAQYNDLAHLAVVAFVDKAAFVHPRQHDLAIIGLYTHCLCAF